jgi:hypothetical protein
MLATAPATDDHRRRWGLSSALVRVYDTPAREQNGSLISRMRVVPTGAVQAEGYVFVFEYRYTAEVGLPGTDRRVRTERRGVRAIRTDVDLAHARVVFDAVNGELLDAVALHATNHCLVLGKTTEVQRRSRRRAFTRVRYWLRDVLSEDAIDDIELVSWTGKREDASYKPVALGGRYGPDGGPRAGRNALILAKREETRGEFEDDFALVALSVETAPTAPGVLFPMDITRELGLYSAAGLDVVAAHRGLEAAITPAASEPTDGWVVAFSLGPQIFGVNIATRANSRDGPSVIVDLSGPASPAPEIRDVRIAGGRIEGPGGEYLLAWTSRAAAADACFERGDRVAWGQTFDWQRGSLFTWVGRACYGAAASISGLTADFDTGSHWHLTFDAVRESGARAALGGFITFGPDTRPRHLMLGASAKAYRAIEPGHMPMAIAFDPHTGRAVMGARGFEHGTRFIDGSFADHAAWVTAVPGRGGDCARIDVGASGNAWQSHKPYAGHRFFTVTLDDGPESSNVSLWVSARPSLSADLCTPWLPLDRSVAFGAVTDADGKASIRLELSETTLPALFVSGSDRCMPDLRDDFPRFLVAQWAWFEPPGLGALAGTAVDLNAFDWPPGLDPSGGRGGPTLEGRVSNPLLLFVDS